MKNECNSDCPLYYRYVVADSKEECPFLNWDECLFAATYECHFGKKETRTDV